MASKKEIRDKENQERLANAISTLDSIARNNNIQKKYTKYCKRNLDRNKG